MFNIYDEDVQNVIEVIDEEDGKCYIKNSNCIQAQ